MYIVIMLMLLMLILGMMVPLAKAGCMTSIVRDSGTAASFMKLVQSCFAVAMAVIMAYISSQSFWPLAYICVIAAVLMVANIYLVGHKQHPA
jgi:hypothetical protein